MAATDFEKLGAFYLGKSYDPDTRSRGDELLLYDSKDLVTHAVCVGMTGSGKTGLCLSLLEEAAIDSIPAIAIDPKGDLANLLLTFPELKPEDFRPWVNEEDARKKGMDAEAFAAQQAELWKRGLAEWGQDGERIARLRASAEFTVYTPGSSAGVPVSVLKSFSAPPAALIEDHEALRERISSTVSSLLGLLNIEADPIQSREHILLSTIFDHAWRAGKSLDLAELIQNVQTPPVKRVGVMDLETIYPAKERFGLAMAMNNLLASPGFAAWSEGEALDIASILHTPQGKPRIAIFSIAHLGDSERMFFVSLLMTQILSWVRAQSGTTSLRALVYMDEIAGYFPPVANPPSKQPMLTLMKQARAFGVGMVLATQNPVDLDYKGLANAGTWFIGRLQTERDKARVLDGLEGAAAQASSRFDRGQMDALLSKLGSRVFLMSNVHDDHPTVFETRWAMSYLRGPLTRTQIKQLMEGRKAMVKPPQADSAGVAVRSTAAAGPVAAATRPVLASEVPEYFIASRAPEGAPIQYEPRVLGTAKVYFSDAKLGVDSDEPLSMVAEFGDGPVPIDWAHAEATELTESDLERSPVEGATFAPLPPEAAKAKSYEAWKKAFADAIFRTHELKLMKSTRLGVVSAIGENERDFRVRLQQVAREQRDMAVEKLRAKYASKVATLQERIRKAEQQVEVQKEQAKQAKMQTAVSFGSAVLGAILGRKVASAGNVGRAATAARGVGRSSKEASDVGRAEENVNALAAQLAELEEQITREAEEVASRLDPTDEVLECVALKPKKTNIQVRAVVLAWAPITKTAWGGDSPAWR